MMDSRVLNEGRMQETEGLGSKGGSWPGGKIALWRGVGRGGACLGEGMPGR